MSFNDDPNARVMPADDAAPAGDSATVELRGYTYDDRGRILEALESAMEACGCWILEQKPVSPTQTALRFEVQLRVVFELYSELVAAGVELTRESHARLTELCTLREHNHHRMRRRRVLTVRLEVSFLEEGGGEFGAMSIGLA